METQSGPPKDPRDGQFNGSAVGSAVTRRAVAVGVAPLRVGVNRWVRADRRYSMQGEPAAAIDLTQRCGHRVLFLKETDLLCAGPSDDAGDLNVVIPGESNRCHMWLTIGANKSERREVAINHEREMVGGEIFRLHRHGGLFSQVVSILTTLRYVGLMPLFGKNPEPGDPFRKNEHVVATEDLVGVPEGTPGRVKLVNGFDWIRYWVFFENGAQLGSIGGNQLVRPQHWRQFKIDREERIEREALAAEQALLAPDEAAAGGEAAAVAEDPNDPLAALRAKVGPRLLELSANARIRVGIPKPE